MTIFTIYYSPKNGEILAYLESGLLPPEGEGPKGSARICYDRVVPILDKELHYVNMKVDLGTKQLVSINVPNIVTENPPSSGNPTAMVPDPNREIRHVEG